MKKTLIFVGLLLLATSAFAAPPTHYNIAFDGYCDTMSLTLGTGAQMSNVAGPKVFVAGSHNVCGAATWINSGFKVGQSKLIPPYATPVLLVSDPEAYGSVSVTYNIAPTPTCVWANYYSVDGVHNNNYIYDTCTRTAAPTRGSGTRSSSPVPAK